MSEPSVTWLVAFAAVDRLTRLAGGAELTIRRWRRKGRKSHMMGCRGHFNRGLVCRATTAATNFRPFSDCSRSWIASRLSAPRAPASHLLVASSICAEVTGAASSSGFHSARMERASIWPNCRRVCCSKPLRVT